MKNRWAFLVGLTAFYHFNSLGVTHYWTGAVSADFYNATNWVPVGVPTASDTFWITNGNVNASPPFATAGQANWSGGSIAGLNIAVGGVVTLSGLDAKYLSGQMTNAGTLRLYSPLQFNGNSRALVNLAGGLIDVQGDVSLLSDGNNAQQILNAGTFRKSAGPNASTVSGIAFQNSGTLSALDGTLDLQGGGSLAGSCTAASGAAVTFSGGSFLLINSAAFGGGGFVGVVGGSVTFSGTLATPMSWTGGTIYGGFRLATNGWLAVSGAGTRALGAVVTNAGTITLASPIQFLGYGLWVTNQPGGLIDAQGDVGLSSDGNNAQQILNAGIFRKSAGPNVCAVNRVAFHNSGTVWAQHGTVDLQSGGALAGSCTADSGAAVIFSGGTYSVTTTAAFGGAGFVGVNAGSPAFTGTLATTLDWTGGSIGGNWTLAGSGLVLMSGYGTKHLAGTVTNYGTMNLSGALEFHYNGVQLVNQAGALFDVQEDVSIFSDGNGAQQILNAGTFRKSGGPGLLTLGITFVNSGQLAIQSGALSLSAPLTMNAGTVNGTVLINSANLAGTLTGAVTWTSGTVLGQLTIGAGSTLTLSGVETKYLQAALTNAGTLVVASPLQFNGNSRTLVNLAGGLIDVQGDVNLFSDGNNAQQILNAGTFRKSAGLNASAVSGIAFQNSGTLLAQSGTVDLQGGGTLAGACTAAGGAAVTFSGGNFTAATSAVFGGGGFVGVAGGTIGLNGTLATPMSWTGGTIYGQFNLATNGWLAASGAGTRLLGAVVTNAGTITLASPVQFLGYGMLVANQAGGLIDVQGDVGLSSDGNNAQQLINAGTFRKSAGPNACTVNRVAFHNSGTVLAQSGTVDLQSGGTLAGPCTADSGAAVIFSGGTYSVTTNAAFGGAGFVGVNAGSPAFNGTLATTLDWTGGYLGGTWTLASNGMVLMHGYGTKHLAGTVTNYGTMKLSGALEFHNSGVQLLNQAGALFDVQGDVTIFSDGNSGQQILNAGTFRKSAGPGLLTLGIAFVNSGQLVIQSGALSLSAPLTMNGGTVNGTVLINSANLAGTLTGAVTWTSGTVQGQLTVGVGSTLTLSGIETKYLQAALTNAGTLVVASPLQFNGNGRTLVNLAGGLIDVQGDVNLFSDGNNSQQILNAGTFRKSAGPNAGGISGIAFQNSGTLLAQNGTVDLQGGGTLAGTCQAADGAAVTFSGGTFTLTNTAVFGGGGFVGVASGAITLNGTLATPMGWTGGTIYGQFNLATNGWLAASGAGTRSLGAVVTNAGTITLASPLRFLGYGMLVANQAGGLFDVQGDVAIFSDGNNAQQLINAGTFRKSAGPNACAVNGIAFRNAGTVGILGGQLFLNTPFTNSGGGLVLRMNSAQDWGQLVCSSAVVLGAPLQVSFAGGYSPQVGGQFRIVSGTSLVGTFSPVTVQSGIGSVSYTTNGAFLSITATFPQLSSPTLTGGHLYFSLNTESGQSYTVQSNDDLRTDNWVFATSFTGNGSVMQVMVPAPGVPQRFFRVRQP